MGSISFRTIYPLNNVQSRPSEPSIPSLPPAELDTPAPPPLATTLFTSTRTSAVFDTSNFYDPLRLNVRKQTCKLLDIVKECNPDLEHQYAPMISTLGHFVGGMNVGVRQMLEAVSRLLSVPELCEIVARLFRPLLLGLTALWLEEGDEGKVEGEEEARMGVREERLIAFAWLLEVYDELFPVFYEFLIKFFPHGPLHFVEDEMSTVDSKRLQRLLLAYFRVQQANRELPEQLSWSLAPLTALMWSPTHNHSDAGVKLLAVRCYAHQTGMGEAEREKVERAILGAKDGVDVVDSIDCWVDGGKEVDGKERTLDGWVIPVTEDRRVKSMREEIAKASVEDFYTPDEGKELIFVRNNDLSCRIVNVHGVLLPRKVIPSHSQAQLSELIPTPTTITALRQLALHISMRVPTLLTSAPSAGKSLLLAHFAKLLHPQTKNQIITIHLADTSLDPRALLGSYVSSPTKPGTFEWREGVLVRAMREGRWVVLEDIDRGSSEVLGTIKPLVESMRWDKWIGGCARMDVPSRGRVIAHQDFLLFATRSVTTPGQGQKKDGGFAPPVFFGANKFWEMTLKAPKGKELETIMEKKFERLRGSPTAAIIDLWEGIKALGTAASVRDVGLRELEKLGARVERLLPTSYQPPVGLRAELAGDVDMIEEDEARGSEEFTSLWRVFPNPNLREEIYLEARDVFFGAGGAAASAKVHLEAVARLVGEKLGLDEERRAWLVNGRTPEMDTEMDVNGNVVAVRVGRTRFATHWNQSLAANSLPVRPFAMHRPAKRLLSRIMTNVALSEPVLLTGETGTGKTSTITHLANLLGRSLISLNLSHQTESSDLIGGLKPVDTRIPAASLQERFLELFGATFSRKRNEKFEIEVRKAVNEGRWKRVVGLWRESGRLAKERLAAKAGSEETRETEPEFDAPRKRRKMDSVGSLVSWENFLNNVDEFEVQYVQGKGKFAFGFVEGPLVKALRSGDWILLDEINLASPETLECISGLLHGPTSSITLTEQGSLEPVPRHPDFRLFACMNPATDVGKKDLPPNIRSRFTEIDVPSPDADNDSLLAIIERYIGVCAAGDKGIIMNIAEFYIAIKDLAEKRQLADGDNHRPHFSMRTLARALTFATDAASMYGLRRAVWEGCLMAFTMVLDPPSAEIVLGLMHKHLLMGVLNPNSMLHRVPSIPHGRSPDDYVKFGPFYLEKGPYPEDNMEEYVMTDSVETKLVDLARIVMTRRFPVLIEGPTSSGKTSSVEYLARRTGHRFVRINNHEHTDIQEYLGSYVSDPLTGKLIFKDGLLVQALRNGDWIVLDELNLAPTDVLEALNRLLDDNRELVIPETQEVIRPHPRFMLFATQNPPGLYAGRKVLSRAFRNRFLEVHFQDVPQAELETILCQRCRVAPSYGKRIVAVFRELQKRRQAGRVFETKHGFVTLRDLFRWASRDAVGYQELANNGYMLLAERARREDDKSVVKDVIQSIMGVQINEDDIYNLHQPGVDMAAFLGAPLPSTSNIIWTKAMQRLYTLVCRALKFNEPVLLVGETGSGKTSICQVYADVMEQRLYGFNCHQNTETADIIGALRPVRNRTALEAEVFEETAAALIAVGMPPVDTSFDNLAALLIQTLKSHQLTPETHGRLVNAQQRLLRLQSIFEWHDGPLVEAMRNGDVFLLDEISLADDSVLERLNSVLEPERTIVLAEKGGSDFLCSSIKATDNFKLVATMNPGGDYGKKELSPALRNRFTEIWVPRVDDRADLEFIIDNLWKYVELKVYTQKMLDYIEWLSARIGDKTITSIRDVIAWVIFSNVVYKPERMDTISAPEIFHHAAHMTYLDGLSSLPQLSAYTLEGITRLKEEALAKLHEMVPLESNETHEEFLYDINGYIQLGSFAIERGPNPTTLSNQSFNLTAPTSRKNAVRILRACQLRKPILLEGSPGVGKTSLVVALANLSGHRLCRINLSDQTDLIDLFGSDLPVEGGVAGEFTWRDAEFLKALQQGDWVLLDEMNLAPQAVLEGLNAILDHRGTVYIPELGRSFTCHPSFRIFAAQNPLSQGGGRKGLPKSFINRFTEVYVDELTSVDLHLICRHLLPQADEDTIKAMVSFNDHINEEVTIRRAFGQQGMPWEFNLRDLIRWGALFTSAHIRSPAAYFQNVYLQRFRTSEDRARVRDVFNGIFSTLSSPPNHAPKFFVSPSHLQVGHFRTGRNNFISSSRLERVIKAQLTALETTGDCVSQNWLVIITGPRDSGKSHLVRAIADFTGNPLREISVNSNTDTMDIIGSFEQVDVRAQVCSIARETLDYLDQILRTLPGTRDAHDLLAVRDSLMTVQNQIVDETAAPCLLRIATLLSRLSDQSSLVVQDLIRHMDILRSSSSAGRFEWMDGPLIQAMRKGQWLLLDGANLCNPSVLDRLNSLCEPGGLLTLSERGLVNGTVETIRPHPNFRLFMAVDPQYGELSRAMRNRGLEIFLSGGLYPDDSLILMDFHRLPYFEANTDHLNLMSLAYRAIKNGLAQPCIQLTNAIASSGRSFDPYSPLSNIMDRFSLYLTPTNDIELDAATFFVSRTFHHANIPYLHRVLDMCDGRSEEMKSYLRALVDLLSGQQLQPVIGRITQYMVERNICSPQILSAQALDDFIEDIRITLNASSASAILHILNFIASIFLERQSHQIRNEVTVPITQSAERLLSVTKAFLANLSYSNEDVLKLLSSNLDQILCLNVLPTLITLNSLAGDLRATLFQQYLDHSAVQVIAKEIKQLLNDGPRPIQGLVPFAEDLCKAVALSSENKLLEIWTAWKCNYALLRKPYPELNYLACNLADSPIRIELRRQILQTLSLVSLPFKSTTEAEELPELLSTLQKRLYEHPRQVEIIKPSPLVLELSLLSRMEVPLASELEQFLNIVCQTPSESLSRYVAMQNFTWAVDVKQDVAVHHIHAIFNWLDSLWTIPADESTINHIIQPSQMMEALKFCDHENFTVELMAQHEKTIALLTEMTFLASMDTRTNQLMVILRQILAAVFSESDQLMNPTFFDKAQIQECHIIDYIDLLGNSPGNGTTAKLFRKKYESLQLLGQCKPQQRLHDLGSAWVATGIMLLEILIPEVPIDPAAIHNTSSVIQEKQSKLLASEISLHQHIEYMATGNTDNFILSSLREKLRGERALPIFNIPDRNDIARLHDFWVEVQQFKDQIASEDKIYNLVRSFGGPNGDAYMREQVLQESITGFCQRLKSVYPQFGDLIMLLTLALSQIRMGMRIILAADRINAETYKTTMALIQYPFVCSNDGILVSDDKNKSSFLSAIDQIMLKFMTFEFQKSLGVEITSFVEELERSYEQAFRLWNIDKTREAENEAVSQSLYRASSLNHDAMTESEIERQEFLTLFPSFEDALNHESSQMQGKRHSDVLVTPSHMSQTVDLHFRLFLSSVSPRDTVKKAHDLRRNLLSASMPIHVNELPDSVDTFGLVHRLRLLHEAQNTATKPIQEHLVYNFYRDPNLPELKKAGHIVGALRSRLEQLLKEWPEQMVLQHLIDLCNVIMGFNLTSPVAKILTALEQLLLQTDDWEMFSNRENTLFSHRQAITTLIVDWRRLELACWNQLLDAEARDFTEAGSEWWFRIYDALVRGSYGATDTGGIDEYLSNLIPLLDEFILSSPLGQFTFRIRLLESFEHYIFALNKNKTGPQRCCLYRVTRIVHSTLQYYGMFQASLDRYLTEQRISLDKEIKDYIKLASWKDINVHALKQSSQRTHHQLYKVIRKFREILREPIVFRLKTDTSLSNPDSLSLSNAYGCQNFVARILLLPDTLSAAISGPLENLNATFTKFEYLVSSQIRDYISRKSHNHADDLASTIIARSKELSEVEVPTNISAEKRIKFLKSLSVRKRKAFNDLMKELKQIGFSGNIKPEILYQNQDKLWLRSQPVLAHKISDDIEKEEMYFCKLCASIPELRTSLSNHHDDLQTGELQRGLSFLESGFSLAVDLRARLAGGIEDYLKLERTSYRLSFLSRSKIQLLGKTGIDKLRALALLLCRLSGAFIEIVYDLNVFENLRKPRTVSSPIEDVENYLNKSNNLRDRMKQVQNDLSITSVPALLIDECEVITASLEFINECVAAFQRWSTNYSHLRYLFQPVMDWLSSEQTIDIQYFQSPEGPPLASVEPLLNVLLYTVQLLVTEINSSTSGAEGGGEKQVLKGYKEICNFTHLLSLNRILEQLDMLLRQVTTAEDLHRILSCVIPFLDVYRSLVRDQLIMHARWTKAIFKLDFVLCSILLTLAKSGFCQPPETDEADDGGGTTLETTGEGTGLGEGTGTENVSKEVEEESQLEGLKDEDEVSQERSKNDEEDDGIEMSQDFAGALQDVPDDGSNDESEQSDNVNEEEPEERIEDVDPTDPSALDEKIWGDESGPKDSEDIDDKTGKDHSKDQSGSSEVVAKESDEKSKKEKDEKDQQSEFEKQDGEESVAEEDQKEEEDGEPNGAGTTMEDYMQDANALDLPDDIEFGIGEEERHNDVSDEELEDLPQDQAEEEDVPMEDKQPEEHDGMIELNAVPESDGNGEDVEMENAIEGKEDDQGAADESPNEVTARPDTSAGEGDANVNDETRLHDQDTSSTTGRAGTSAAHAGQKTTDAEERVEHVRPYDNIQQTPPEEVPGDGKGSAMSGLEQGQKESKTEWKTLTNPLRNLGDTLKEIRQHFDEILYAEAADQPKENIGSSEAPSQLEYLRPEDSDHDMQALGPAGEEQVAKLEDIALIDEDAQPDSTTAMDIDEQRKVERLEKPIDSHISQGDAFSSALQENVEGAVLSSNIPQSQPLAVLPDSTFTEAGLKEEKDEDVEAELRLWQAANFPQSNADRMWRLYESMTHDLAYALCEQLRLILEPTLATRLKGDFRTGKRLNMKKIIPYIASDYTKDKIWLRRTKPSQREYQVLIAIDDSHSMAESHSIHLAYQTLALISKALSRLEAGDIAIARFGGTVDILHGFDQGPFTDQAGTEVVSAFTFNQKSTNVLALIDTSLKVLESARERRSMSSASAADLWQLEIIISDGICQDHDKLRALLRKAEEQKVMIVFIILDSLHSHVASGTGSKDASAQSILTMTKADFKNVDGKMEMELRKYLDSFPFEYYVVLRNVEALPEVLSGTLKQFFERISEE